MKRRDLMRMLAAAGLSFKEGGSHTLVYRGDRQISAVPRHREINRLTVKLIEKQTGLRLL